MKDIILSTRRQKTELLTWLVCFVIANLVNLGAILSYDAPLLELVTSIGYVTVFSIVMYVAWTALRLVYAGIKPLMNKKQQP